MISSDSSYSLNMHVENGPSVAFSAYPHNDNNLTQDDDSESDSESYHYKRGSKVLKKQLKKQLSSYGVDLNLLGE